MFSRKSNSTSVSRAPSFSDQGSIDIERTTSALHTVSLNGSGRRTMSLEEEDEDDGYTNPWDALQASSGPMSSVSEARSDVMTELSPTNEVTVLRISHLIKGCTTAQLYKAFDMKKEDMRIEVQSADEALLHFDNADQAMKAYFTYLSSTSSLGTVSPYEAGIDSLSSSPIKHHDSILRNRRSFQGNNGSSTMLSALSNISSWRSSDKLHTMNSYHNDRDHRPGHRSTSSRSSIHSKSVERIPSLAMSKIKPVHSLTMSTISTTAADEEKPLTMRSNPAAPAAPTTLRASSTPIASKPAFEKTKMTSKTTSTAKRLLATGLGLRPKTAKEKEEKAARESAKNESLKAKQKRKEDEKLTRSMR